MSETQELTDEQALARVIDAKKWLEEAAAIGNAEAVECLRIYGLVKANPASGTLRALLRGVALQLPHANDDLRPPATPATTAWRVIVGDEGYEEVAAVVTDTYSPSHKVVEAAPALAWAIGESLEAVADWANTVGGRVELSDDPLTEIELARMQFRFLSKDQGVEEGASEPAVAAEASDVGPPPEVLVEPTEAPSSESKVVVPPSFEGSDAAVSGGAGVVTQEPPAAGQPAGGTETQAVTVEAVPPRVFPQERTWEYTFDHRIANCGECSLRDQRDATECSAYKPKKFNGVMIVGEGPGASEARTKVPFVGPAGTLLNSLLAQVGLERDECYITNATGCKPPYTAGKGKKGLLQLHQDAVHACRSRLMTEIYYVQPRVLLLLGNAAMATVCGQETIKNKRVPFDCPTCGNQRKWKQWSCTKKKDCGNKLFAVPDRPCDGPPPVAPPCAHGCGAEDNGKLRPTKTPKWRAVNVKCSTCKGLKTQVVSSTSFAWDYNLTGDHGCAGGIFQASDLPGLAQHLTHAEETYVVPTYHPSFLLREIKTKGDKKIGGQYLASAALAHFRKVKRLLTSEPQWDFTWKLAQTAAELEEYLTASAYYAADIETNAKDPNEVTQIKCIAFAGAGLEQTLVVDTSGLSPHDPMVQVILRWLRDPARRKVWQNGLYDCRVIDRVWGVWCEGYEDDTLIGHNAVAPDEPHHLGHITFLCTDSKPWKPPRGGSVAAMEGEELHEYCARDTRNTLLSMVELKALQEREKTTQVYDLDMQKNAIARTMQKHGMLVDREKMLQVGAVHQYKAEVALKKMRDIVGPIPQQFHDTKKGRDGVLFNPNSPNQLAWALFEPAGPLKLAPTKLTPTHQPSTDKTALLPYVAQPFVDALLAYKAATKVKSTYIDGMPIGADMRLHAAWRPTGARTGRWSSSPNFMNWTYMLMSMVVAAKGRAFVGADADQLELRIAASASGDETMIVKCRDADSSRKLDPDCDPHSYVAAMSLGHAFTSLLMEDPEHDKSDTRCACDKCTRKHFRDITKRTVYGLNYGAGADTILEAIYDGGYEGPPLDKGMIEQTVRAYFKAFPGVEKWRDGMLARARKECKIHDLLLGRMREFPLGKIDATVIYNFPIQSTAATLMDWAMVRLNAELPGVDPTAFIFAQVHDAIYVECDETRAADVARLVDKHMNMSIQLADGASWMPITARAEIGYSWSGVK